MMVSLMQQYRSRTTVCVQCTTQRHALDNQCMLSPVILSKSGVLRVPQRNCSVYAKLPQICALIGN